MRGVAPREAKARTRAAVAYKGWSRNYEALEGATGIKKSTLERILSPTHHRAPTDDEADQIAKACGIPAAFMTEGFEPLARGSVDTSTLSADDQRLVLQAARLLAEAGRQPAQANPPPQRATGEQDRPD